MIVNISFGEFIQHIHDLVKHSSSMIPHLIYADAIMKDLQIAFLIHLPTMQETQV